MWGRKEGGKKSERKETEERGPTGPSLFRRGLQFFPTTSPQASIPLLLRERRRKHPLQPGRELVEVRVLPDAVVVLVRHARLVKVGVFLEPVTNGDGRGRQYLLGGFGGREANGLGVFPLFLAGLGPELLDFPLVLVGTDHHGLPVGIRRVFVVDELGHRGRVAVDDVGADVGGLVMGQQGAFPHLGGLFGGRHDLRILDVLEKNAGGRVGEAALHTARHEFVFLVGTSLRIEGQLGPVQHVLVEQVALRLGAQSVAELALRLEDAGVLVVIEFLDGRLGARAAELVRRLIKHFARGPLLLGSLRRLVVVSKPTREGPERQRGPCGHRTELDARRDTLGPLCVQISHIRCVFFKVLEGLPTGPNGPVAVPRRLVGAHGVGEALNLCVSHGYVAYNQGQHD